MIKFILSSHPQVYGSSAQGLVNARLLFGDSSFNDQFTRSRPAEHIWEVMHDPQHTETKHAIALDNNDEILGEFFSIPTVRALGQEAYNLGWMFTVELHTRFRLEVVFALAERVSDVTRAAGFKRIVTEIQRLARSSCPKSVATFTHQHLIKEIAGLRNSSLHLICILCSFFLSARFILEKHEINSSQLKASWKIDIKNWRATMMHSFKRIATTETLQQDLQI